MNDFILYIGTAFALIFVIEGLLYALFTDSMRKLLAAAVLIPPKKLKSFGYVMALTGLGLLLMLDFFAGGS